MPSSRIMIVVEKREVMSYRPRKGRGCYVFKLRAKKGALRFDVPCASTLHYSPISSNGARSQMCRLSFLTSFTVLAQVQAHVNLACSDLFNFINVCTGEASNENVELGCRDVLIFLGNFSLP